MSDHIPTTDQLRTLAEAEARKIPQQPTFPALPSLPIGFTNKVREGFVQGFIAGRTSVTREQIEGAINALSWGDMVDGPSVAEIARTVHELLNGENDD